jgi:hypothetical protein
MSKATTTKLVTVDSLHFADNPRTTVCMRIPEMVASLQLHGFKDNHPLVVSEKTVGGEIVNHVLCGNRRGSGLIVLRDSHPEDFARVLLAHPGKVPCIVHRGLTPEMETEIRIDHSPDLDRVPLDPWSEYLAIGQLVSIGTYTEEAIAEKLGLVNISAKTGARKPRRSYVQARVALARLPNFVQEEIKKLCLEGRDSTTARWSDVLKLYKIFNDEYVSYNDGDGPDFTSAWKAIMEPAEDTETGKPKPKELSPTEAVKRSQSASSNALKSALLIVTRQSDGNLAEIDRAIAEGETAVKILQAIAEHLGESAYNELVAIALDPTLPETVETETVEV